MKCWFDDCGNTALVRVEEVFFDCGAPTFRLASTEDWSDKPSLCASCAAGRLHEVAEVVRGIQEGAGTFGPMKPTRWWVRLSTGATKGGDVVARH